jgi:thioredoxin-related protein
MPQISQIKTILKEVCHEFHQFSLIKFGVIREIRGERSLFNLRNLWQKKQKQMKKLVLIIFFLGITSTGFCQLQSRSFEAIDSLQQTQKRKIIVFIHTDWCQFCQRMKNTTFRNPEIRESLNSHFYFVNFNAEEKRDIKFNNRIFKYQPTGNNVGVHELALQLGTINGQIVYPVLCVLNERNEIILQYNNYLNPADFKLVLEKLKE